MGRTPSIALRALVSAIVVKSVFTSALIDVVYGQLSETGFNNVHINFETPSGYTLGFLDYLNFFAGSSTGTQVGPIANVGNYGGIVSSSNTEDNTVIPFFRLTDDINQNGVPGSIVIIDPITGTPVFLTDFGDLHQFNIAFDRINAGLIPMAGATDVANEIWFGDDDDVDDEATIVALQAAEALRVRDWQETGIDAGIAAPEGAMSLNAPGFAPQFAVATNRSRRNGVGIIYGVRMIERQDTRSLHAEGGILGSMYFNTEAENHIIGPQIGIVTIKSRGRWTARLQGTASIGFNYGGVTQNGVTGAELIPGATNRLLYAQPTSFSNWDKHNNFSPNAELRAEVNYRMTKEITFAVSWSGVAIENALETEERTVFFLPNMGLSDPGNQRLIVQNFFCGVELVR